MRLDSSVTLEKKNTTKPDAKPHCQRVLLNPATGNFVTRFANGKPSTEPFDDPGDIAVDGGDQADVFIPQNPLLADWLPAIEAEQAISVDLLSVLVSDIKDSGGAGQ